MPRITGQMILADAAQAMGKGSKEAVSMLFELGLMGTIEGLPAISVLLWLDTLEIYGKDIWDLQMHVVGGPKRYKELVQILKLWSEGVLHEDRLRQHIRDKVRIDAAAVQAAPDEWRFNPNPAAQPTSARTRV